MLSKIKRCNCLEKINKKLQKDNTKILAQHIFSKNYVISIPQIEVAKFDKDSKMRPKPVVASYCPFCGLKYPE